MFIINAFTKIHPRSRICDSQFYTRSYFKNVKLYLHRPFWVALRWTVHHSETWRFSTIAKPRTLCVKNSLRLETSFAALTTEHRLVTLFIRHTWFMACISVQLVRYREANQAIPERTIVMIDSMTAKAAPPRPLPEPISPVV